MGTPEDDGDSGAPDGSAGTGGEGGATGGAAGTAGTGGTAGTAGTGGTAGTAGTGGTAGSSGSGGGAAGSTPECTAGERSCSSDTTPRRCEGGTWVDEAPCATSTPHCLDGSCVQCVDSSHCAVDTACADWNCDSTHNCVGDFMPLNTPVTDVVTGDCKRPVCDGAGEVISTADDTDLPDDGNECTDDTCSSGFPGHPVQTGASCGLNGTCSASANCVESVAGCGGVAGLQSGSPWPMTGYCPSHQGRSPYAGPDTLAIAAQSEAAGFWFWGAAVAASGVVYFGGGDETDLFAIASNASPLWSFPAKRTACPAVGSDGTVYAPSNNDKIYALRPDGSTKWSFDRSPGKATCPGVGADGTVYVGSGSVLHAVRPDGTSAWDYDFGSYTTLWNAPTVAADGTVYAGTSEGTIYAVTASGSLKWQYPTGDGTFGLMAVGSDGTLYAGSNDHCLYALNPNGTKKWSFCKQAEMRSVALAEDGTVYVGCFDGNVYAVDDGTQKWAFPTAGTPRGEIVVDSRGVLYFSSFDAERATYAVNADGSERAKMNNVMSAHAITASGHLVGTQSTDLVLLGPSL